MSAPDSITLAAAWMRVAEWLGADVVRAKPWLPRAWLQARERDGEVPTYVLAAGALRRLPPNALIVDRTGPEPRVLVEPEIDHRVLLADLLAAKDRWFADGLPELPVNVAPLRILRVAVPACDYRAERGMVANELAAKWPDRFEVDTDGALLLDDKDCDDALEKAITISFETEQNETRAAVARNKPCEGCGRSWDELSGTVRRGGDQ